MEEFEGIEAEMALLDRICEEARKADRVVLFTGTAFEHIVDPATDEPIDVLPSEVAS